MKFYLPIFTIIISMLFIFILSYKHKNLNIVEKNDDTKLNFATFLICPILYIYHKDKLTKLHCNYPLKHLYFFLGTLFILLYLIVSFLIIPCHQGKLYYNIEFHHYLIYFLILIYICSIITYLTFDYRIILFAFYVVFFFAMHSLLGISNIPIRCQYRVSHNKILKTIDETYSVIYPIKKLKRWSYKSMLSDIDNTIRYSKKYNLYYANYSIKPFTGVFFTFNQKRTSIKEASTYVNGTKIYTKYFDDTVAEVYRYFTGNNDKVEEHYSYQVGNDKNKLISSYERFNDRGQLEMKISPYNGKLDVIINEDTYNFIKINYGFFQMFSENGLVNSTLFPLNEKLNSKITINREFYREHHIECGQYKLYDKTGNLYQDIMVTGNTNEVKKIYSKDCYIHTTILNF